MITNALIKNIILFCIAALAVALFPACSSNNEPPSSTTPLWGTWELSKINGRQITDPNQRTRYQFLHDPDAPSNTAGKGNYYQFFAASQSFEPSPLLWEITQQNQLLISGSAGAGLFDIDITLQNLYQQLQLTDTATGTVYTFIKS